MFTRPPYGQLFSTIDDKFDFTLVAAHLDSPGESTKANEKQDYAAKDLIGESLVKNKTQGTREINEAYQVANVMKFMDSKDGSNDDLFLLVIRILEVGTNKLFLNHYLMMGIKLYLKTKQMHIKHL